MHGLHSQAGANIIMAGVYRKIFASGFHNPVGSSVPAVRMPAMVASTHGSGSSRSISAPNPGNLLVVFVTQSAAGTAPTVTDNVSGSYTLHPTSATYNGSTNTIYVAYKTALGTETTISFTAGAGTAIGMVTFELTNIGVLPLIEAIANANNIGFQQSSTTSAITTSNPSLVMAAVSLTGAQTPTLWSGTKPMTMAGALGSTQSIGGYYSSPELLSAQTFTAQWSGSRNSGNLVLAMRSPRYSLSFNGSGGVNANAIAGLLTGASFVGWFKMGTLSSYNLLSNAVSASEMFFVQITSLGLQAALYNGANIGVRSTTAVNIPLNAWVHLAYTFDGTTGKVYVNAVDVSNSTSAPTFNSTVGLSLGQRQDANRRLVGNMCRVAIFNRALTTAEVLQHMQGVPVATASLQYEFTEETGTTLNDVSGGTANPGTIVNGTWVMDRP